MTTRTTSKTVNFKKQFMLESVGELLPAGTYTVETDEVPLEGISFIAYRRIQTLLHVPGRPADRVRASVLTIDPEELEAALQRDQAPSKLRSEPDLDAMLMDPIVGLVMRSDGLSESDVRQTLSRRHA